MSTAEPELRIGPRGAQHLFVVPRRRAHPDCGDYWDGNWVDSLVELSVGGFRARFIASLRTEEFATFRQQLEPLFESLSGKATFSSMEDWLVIEVSGDGLGHFRADCEARDEAGIGNSLKFTLSFDQTELSSILQGLRAIEDAFPVLGDPAS